MRPAAKRWIVRAIAIACACTIVRFAVPWWCGRDASAWYLDEPALQRDLADSLVAFEHADDAAHIAPAGDRFAGEWALVTHQMIALGLAQLVLAHPDWRDALAPTATLAARKAMLAEMREFGTRAWGE